MARFEYPDPIQGGEEKVTRQVGVDPKQLVAPDPVKLPDVIQGSPEIFTYRQEGNGHSFFGQDGILRADHPSNGITMVADGPTAPADANQSPILIADQPISRDTDAGYVGFPGVVPGIPTAAPSAAGAPPSVPPVVDVMQADQPGDRGGDPRDMGAPPVVLTKEQIDAAKAAKKAAK